VISKNTEKAIKAWLKLPKRDRIAQVNLSTAKLTLYGLDYAKGSYEVLASYTPQQVINKRYPKRKKAKKYQFTGIAAPLDFQPKRKKAVRK